MAMLSSAVVLLLADSPLLRAEHGRHLVNRTAVLAGRLFVADRCGRPPGPGHARKRLRAVPRPGTFGAPQSTSSSAATRQRVFSVSFAFSAAADVASSMTTISIQVSSAHYFVGINRDHRNKMTHPGPT